MKAGIHPEYTETTFSCSCGHVLQTQSTIGGHRHIEICAQCHPFFKGSSKRVMDTAGRIEKFNRRYNRAAVAE